VAVAAAAVVMVVCFVRHACEGLCVPAFVFSQQSSHLQHFTADHAMYAYFARDNVYLPGLAK
jgi:hypothetical protein